MFESVVFFFSTEMLATTAIAHFVHFFYYLIHTPYVLCCFFLSFFNLNETKKKVSKRTSINILESGMSLWPSSLGSLVVRTKLICVRMLFDIFSSKFMDIVLLTDLHAECSFLCGRAVVCVALPRSLSFTRHCFVCCDQFSVRYRRFSSVSFSLFVSFSLGSVWNITKYNNVV